MGLTKIFKTHERKSQIADNVSVVPGGSQSSSSFTLSDQVNVVTLGYDINGNVGSAKVSVEVYMGQDVNGADVWIEVASSTNYQDIFTVDDEVERVRLVFSETAAVAGEDLTGINAWVRGRTL